MDSGWRKKEFYKIRIEGHRAPSWSETFDGMQLIWTPDGETILSGAVADQAALLGLLARLRDLNLTLISVIRIKEVGQWSHNSATERENFLGCDISYVGEHMGIDFSTFIDSAVLTLRGVGTYVTHGCTGLFYPTTGIPCLH